jgi:hypothetical protein
MLRLLRDSFRGRLKPPLGGFVYRFTLFLPILSEGKVVFSDAQRELLADLFYGCCDGFTETVAEGHPPWYGCWIPPGAPRPLVDQHTLVVVYTPQISAAKDFFAQLRWILEQPQVAGQQVVLIEHVTAWLVESSPLKASNGGARPR